MSKRTIDVIIERLKKAMRMAEYASTEPELDAAISGIIRIMERDGKVITNFGMPETHVIDNKEEITKAIEEKFAALEEVRRLKRENANAELLRASINALQTENLKLKTNIKELKNALIKASRELDGPAPILNPRKSRREAYNIEIMRADISDILKSNNLEITPSDGIAVWLAKPNLLDVLPHLPRELTNEFSHIPLHQDIFKELLNIFVLKGAKGTREGARVMAAVLNNAQFNADDKRQARLLANINNTWNDALKGKQVDPWFAFAIRCGNLQKNLEKYVPVDQQNLL